MTSLRENWRVVLLTVLLVASGVALFGPIGVSADDSGITNLQYGIQLDGGARVRAPPAGMTAENVEVDRENVQAVRGGLVEELDVPPRDVKVSPRGGTIEVFEPNVTRSEFRGALTATNVSFGNIRDGVTGSTRQDMKDVLEQKVSNSGLSRGTVKIVETATGEHYIEVEVPGQDVESLKRLLNTRGVVEVYAQYPTENGTDRTRVLTQDDIASVSGVTQEEGETFVVVTLNSGSAQEYTAQMQRFGFDRSGGTTCAPLNESNGTYQGRCLLTEFDGEVIYGAGVNSGLAAEYRSGAFAETPQFRMLTGDFQEARQLEISLKSGQLAAPLDFSEAQTTYLEPSFAQDKKLYSLIVGLVAVLAVSGTVYVRYGRPEVALPMVVTALSEVVLLLGFAAAVQYPLNLATIAGFIAVIGTGVDDLIIIADEVMSEGDVTSSRVFQSRFRKAFWVIGAAAATTIIALSPLAVLSLGDLQGFAIVTILGVIIGVLVTRPAYGDILRQLTTDK